MVVGSEEELGGIGGGASGGQGRGVGDGRGGGEGLGDTRRVAATATELASRVFACFTCGDVSSAVNDSLACSALRVFFLLLCFRPPFAADCCCLARSFMRVRFDAWLARCAAAVFSPAGFSCVRFSSNNAGSALPAKRSASSACTATTTGCLASVSAVDRVVVFMLCALAFSSSNALATLPSKRMASLVAATDARAVSFATCTPRG